MSKGTAKIDGYLRCNTSLHLTFTVQLEGLGKEGHWPDRLHAVLYVLSTTVGTEESFCRGKVKSFELLRVCNELL